MRICIFRCKGVPYLLFFLPPLSFFCLLSNCCFFTASRPELNFASYWGPKVFQSAFGCLFSKCKVILLKFGCILDISHTLHTFHPFLAFAPFPPPPAAPLLLSPLYVFLQSLWPYAFELFLCAHACSFTSNCFRVDE